MLLFKMLGLVKKVLHKIFKIKNPTDRFFENRDYILKNDNFLSRIYGYQNEKILRKYNASVPCSEKIKPFSTPHELNGIFISAGAVVNDGCTIFHQVTIGSNTLLDSKNPGAPIIGKNVYIGAGAKIIGNIRIGDNVRIGANCVVTRNVPDNATVVLTTPRVIFHDSPRDNTFVQWENF